MFAWVRNSCFLAVALGAVSAEAHFPWLAGDDQGRALLFFSENLAERNYRVPEVLHTVKVMHVPLKGEPRAAELAAVEEEDFMGLQSPADGARGGNLAATVAYGNYNGMLLTYHAKACLGDEIAGWRPMSLVKFDVTPRLGKQDQKLELTATWQGRPLAGAKATLLSAAGEPVEAKTDEHGVARFDRPAGGLVGCLVERNDAKAKGTANGKAYTSAIDYATLTFIVPAADDASPVVKPVAAPTEKAPAAAAFPPLPKPVASFGGAVCNGRLYVYGGHIGEEHKHSRENLSQQFCCIALDGGAAATWESLPMATPLQGLPLVAHGDQLYRVGGLSLRNEPQAAEDLHSVAEFARFDPQSRTWTSLPPLPEPRSSHDAAVVGDVLYVVGGWSLTGTSPGKWLATAWSIDLSDPQAQWQPLPDPPFARRALAAAAWRGKLVALGGMDDKNDVSRRVDLFDPVAGSWSRLPDMPGEGMAGFGASAWALGDALFASSSDGQLLRLTSDADAWTAVGRLATGRFLHRLLPAGDHALLAVAGASAEEGHLAAVERLPIVGGRAGN